MLLLLGALLLIGFVYPQDLDWESTCVTDPNGTPRVHLENHSPWQMDFLIRCYDSSFWVNVRPQTTEIRMISFPWTPNPTECIAQEFSDKTYMVYTYAYYNDKSAPPYQDFRYNHTWCSRQPGLLDDVRAYSTCSPNANGNLDFYFLNFFNEPVQLYFGCFDVYMDGLVPYWDNKTYMSVIEPRTRVRLEISVWRPELAEQLQRCVLDFDKDGFSFLHFAALDFPTTGKYYYIDSRIWCKRRQADDKPKAEVFVRCPASKYGVPLLVLRSDMSAYAVADCKNGRQPFSTVNDVSATLQGTFSQDPDETDCQFFKKVERDTFSVVVEVGWGQPGKEIFFGGETQTVTCVYDDVSGAETAVERVGKPLFAPEDTSVFMGKIYTGIFTVRILDVFNRETYVSSLASGRLIRLRVTENTDGVNGFRAHSCLAKNGITSYPILQNGCGDGIIIPRTSGFLTVGNVVYSPFFKVFRLRGGRNIWFDCLFALCDDGLCDGSSCAVEDYGFEIQPAPGDVFL